LEEGQSLKQKGNATSITGKNRTTEWIAAPALTPMDHLEEIESDDLKAEKAMVL